MNVVDLWRFIHIKQQGRIVWNKFKSHNHVGLKINLYRWLNDNDAQNRFPSAQRHRNRKISIGIHVTYFVVDCIITYLFKKYTINVIMVRTTVTMVCNKYLDK